MTPMSPLGYYIQSYSPAIVSTISRYVGLQNVVGRRCGTTSPLRRYCLDIFWSPATMANWVQFRKTYKLEILKEGHTPEGFENLSSCIWNDQESREQCFEVCSTLQCEPRRFFEGS